MRVQFFDDAVPSPFGPTKSSIIHLNIPEQLWAQSGMFIFSYTKFFRSANIGRPFCPRKCFMFWVMAWCAAYLTKAVSFNGGGIKHSGAEYSYGAAICLRRRCPTGRYRRAMPKIGPETPLGNCVPQCAQPIYEVTDCASKNFSRPFKSRH